MSDIHFETARNSELIFTLRGRHLCSSIHPTKEAQQWIAHHHSLWHECRSIIVLGLGCGYHVRALKMSPDAKVLVLEPSRDVIQAALRVHPLDLSEAELFHWTSVNDITVVPALVEATKQSYAVLLHEPSAFSNPDLYTETKEFLLGRKEQGLRWLFHNRGVEMPAMSETREINFKTLDFLWHKQLQGEAPVQPTMQALRELIA